MAVELLDALQGRGQETMTGGPVPPSQLRALMAIERCEGVNLRSLSDLLGSRPSAVSRLCDRMEADGLVRRSLSANSRREVELRLSRRAHTLLAEYRTARVREIQVVLRTMSSGGVTALATGMAELRDAVRAREGMTSADAPHGDARTA